MPEGNGVEAYGCVIRELLRQGDPDEPTFRLRWAMLFAALQREHPDFPKSGFVEDEPAK